MNSELSSTPAPPGPRRAFTLVELIVAILILAVVLAITLPFLSGARAMSVASRCLSNLRSCTQSVLLYTEDFRGAFPYLAQVRDDQRAFQNGGIWLPYYSQAGHWPLAMRGYQGVGESPVHASQLCPASSIARDILSGGYDQYIQQYPPETVIPSHYWLTYAAFTDPTVWRPGVDPMLPSGFRSVRTDEVLFPGAKTLLSEPIAYHLGPFDAPASDSPISLFSPAASASQFHAAFADSSVRSVPFSDFHTLPETNTLHTPTLATPDGIRGRDLR